MPPPARASYACLLICSLCLIMLLFVTLASHSHTTSVVHYVDHTSYRICPRLRPSPLTPIIHPSISDTSTCSVHRSSFIVQSFSPSFPLYNLAFLLNCTAIEIVHVRVIYSFVCVYSAVFPENTFLSGIAARSITTTATCVYRSLAPLSVSKPRSRVPSVFHTSTFFDRGCYRSCLCRRTCLRN